GPAEPGPADTGGATPPPLPASPTPATDFGPAGVLSAPPEPLATGPSAAAAPRASASNPRVLRSLPLQKVVTKRSQQAVALGLLAAIGLGLWWFGGQQARSPRLLGSLGEGAPAPDAGLYVPSGGIGRFAR